jgi:integrase
MFKWAIREGHELPANPVAGTNTPAEPPSRARVLSDAELAELWAALGDSQFDEIVRLLILTGQRREEIGGLRWSEIDFGRAIITLGPERTKTKKPHEVPLSSLALSVFERQPRRWPWVFGNARRTFNNWGTPKSRLPALTAPYRLHDLRRSCATGMANLGEDARRPWALGGARREPNGHARDIIITRAREVLVDALPVDSHTSSATLTVLLTGDQNGHFSPFHHLQVIVLSSSRPVGTTSPFQGV